MIFGSLFAGIGGFDLGLERAGMVVRWQVEVDAYARGILARHWPDVPRWSDIRLCDAATLAPVDLVCGGFPCQDISSAGKGAGITGRRSGLWREMLRLVHELRPRWVLAENVPALRTRGADVVLGDLEAAGYACWPLVVGAWAVGAPHRRDRVWIVGRRVGDTAQLRERAADVLAPAVGGERARHDARGSGELADAERGALRDESGRRGGTNGAGATGVGANGGRLADPADGGRRAVELGYPTDGRESNAPRSRKAIRLAHVNRFRCACEWCSGLPDEERAPFRHHVDRLGGWPARPGEPQKQWEYSRTLEPRMGRAAHGLSRRLALKALGNAVVPQVAEVIGRAIVEAHQDGLAH